MDLTPEQERALASLDARPPSDLADRLLAGAEASRPAGTPTEGSSPAPAIVALRSQVDLLHELLSTIEADEWRARALPYDWSVHGLVAHLLGVERYTASLIGLAGAARPTVDEHDHVAMTEPTVSEEMARPPSATASDWYVAARRVLDHLDGQADALRGDVLFHGLPVTLEGLLVLRTFEVWTHLDDVRRALGRPVDSPEPSVLRAMSGLSVGSLQSVLAFTAPDHAHRAAKVVLTGAGGGTWRWGVGEPAVTVVADVVDYCRVASRRLDPGDLEQVVEGDAALGRALLEAARVLAA